MKRSVKVWWVFLGVFLAGAVAGGFLSLRVAKSMVDRGRGADQFAPRTMERLTARLELSEAQREAIRPIIEATAEDMRKARRETIESIQRMEAAVAKVLDDAQREKLAELQTEQRERWRQIMERREQKWRESEPPAAAEQEKAPAPAN